MNKSNMFKGKVSIKKLIISLLVIGILEFIAFYIFLPELNIHSVDSWIFQGIFVVAFFVSTFSMPAKDEYAIKYNILSKIVGGIIAVAVVVFIIGSISSAKIFNASRYSSMIKVEEADFQEQIPESDTVNDIALMDTSSARVVGERAIGSLSDVVSQYTINPEYNTIDLNGQPMKIATLEYAGFFKWFNNRKDGIPGYVLVDPVKFEAQYVKLNKSIKYTTSGWFNDSLQRHLRFQYPTAIFEGYYFELDNDNNPYYICPILTAKISLFGGYDVKGLVICDPCTGDSKYYDLKDIPQWADRVYDGDLSTQKFDWFGTLSDGFINSVIGQKDCKKTTADYGYKVMNNDVWVYTGVTSVIDDSSNIGFVMINSRTSEAKYFKVAGAEEFSAMDAAEGQVQNLGYTAAFPSIVNIGGEPTYFMVLKDKANLVKQYALVNVKKYSIVATGVTQRETLSTYKKLLRENNIKTNISNEDETNDYRYVDIEVKNIQYVNVEGDTYVYITDENGNVYKKLFSEDESLIFVQNGDKIRVFYEEIEGSLLKDIMAWESPDATEQETTGNVIPQETVADETTKQ